MCNQNNSEHTCAHKQNKDNFSAGEKIVAIRFFFLKKSACCKCTHSIFIDMKKLYFN